MDKATELALKELDKKVEALTRRVEIIEANLGLGKFKESEV